MSPIEEGLEVLMRRGFAALLMLALTATVAHAQQAASSSHDDHAIAWTAVGAGAGFGVGLVAGLGMFDDAVNSDRKVWTTAVVSAAAGGVVAFLLSRSHKSSRHASATAPLTDAEVRMLTAQVRLAPSGGLPATRP
jgi:peptidoglycan/LPS O-acetylase OafA/YrhL